MAGGEPGSKPVYAAVGYLLFESVEVFQAAMMPHFKEMVADVPNYTDITPILQIAEVTL
jgi:uncharacterized protein (TIGR02118 family)